MPKYETLISNRYGLVLKCGSPATNRRSFWKKNCKMAKNAQFAKIDRIIPPRSSGRQSAHYSGGGEVGTDSHRLLHIPNSAGATADVAAFRQSAANVTGI
jgi:hypothetical protein